MVEVKLIGFYNKTKICKNPDIQSSSFDIDNHLEEYDSNVLYIYHGDGEEKFTISLYYRKNGKREYKYIHIAVDINNPNEFLLDQNILRIRLIDDIYSRDTRVTEYDGEISLQTWHPRLIESYKIKRKMITNNELQERYELLMYQNKYMIYYIPQEEYNYVNIRLTNIGINKILALLR